MLLQQAGAKHRMATTADLYHSRVHNGMAQHGMTDENMDDGLTGPVRGPATFDTGGGGSYSDDLASYINRLTRTKLLTAAEEKTLSRRVGFGDFAAKERLIEANMRLVVSIAKNYLASGIPLEDLIQEGAIGLMTATERFDPRMGYRFSTYATQWIRQSIGRAIDNKAKSIRLPAHISESLRKIDKAKAELHRELGEEPTIEQIAAHAGLSLKKMNSLLQTTQEPISLDMSVGDDNTSLGTLVLDRTAPNPQDELIAQEMRGEIEAILSTLDDREQIVMRKRFGFDEDDKSVLQQIGDELNISRERVRQIESQALRKLRSAARKKRLRDYLQS
jgi:RNA polymerase primary sigma factor